MNSMIKLFHYNLFVNRVFMNGSQMHQLSKQIPIFLINRYLTENWSKSQYDCIFCPFSKIVVLTKMELNICFGEGFIGMGHLSPHELQHFSLLKFWIKKTSFLFEGVDYSNILRKKKFQNHSGSRNYCRRTRTRKVFFILKQY